MPYSRIYEIRKLDVAFLRKVPPDIVITAEGRTSTSGWTGQELGQHIYIEPPKDGLLDFDFLAKSPTGNVLKTLTKIVTGSQLRDVDIDNYWGKGMPLKGVRVHSLTNAVTYKFPKKLSKKKYVTL